VRGEGWAGGRGRYGAWGEGARAWARHPNPPSAIPQHPCLPHLRHAQLAALAREVEQRRQQREHARLGLARALVGCAQQRQARQDVIGHLGGGGGQGGWVGRWEGGQVGVWGGAMRAARAECQQILRWCNHRPPRALRPAPRGPPPRCPCQRPTSFFSFSLSCPSAFSAACSSWPTLTACRHPSGTCEQGGRQGAGGAACVSPSPALAPALRRERSWPSPQPPAQRPPTQPCIAPAPSP
jgi:hypothetical protein